MDHSFWLNLGQSCFFHGKQKDKEGETPSCTQGSKSSFPRTMKTCFIMESGWWSVGKHLSGLGSYTCLSDHNHICASGVVNSSNIWGATKTCFTLLWVSSFYFSSRTILFSMDGICSMLHWMDFSWWLMIHTWLRSQRAISWAKVVKRQLTFCFIHYSSKICIHYD